ncbi:MAG: hypothetical protein ABSG93_15160 [Solirubrobacteraceae bacterium]|jgi:hypothetical protein
MAKLDQALIRVDQVVSLNDFAVTDWTTASQVAHVMADIQE